MSDRAYDIWVYDQLQPDEIIRSGYKAPRRIPAWAEPFPDRLIGLAPEEIDQQERDRRNDEYLKLHGI